MRLAALRWAELVGLFVVGPMVFAVWIPTRWLFPSMWVLAAVCAVILRRDAGFDRAAVWNAAGLKRAWRRMLAMFVVCAAAMGVVLWVVEPERVFVLPRERPALWGMIMVLYPLLSVWPQEYAARVFFYRRYGGLVGASVGPVERMRGGDWRMVALNAAVFGWMHIVMWNWLAVAMSVVGGGIFAYTYARTRSLAAVWVEHAAYGCWVFTVGWGWYFFAGAAR